jgi:3-methyladenine DNA glycosylase/8-oxoguanine DNA glycosylase
MKSGVEMNIEIAIKPPFSLTSVVNSHGWVQLRPFSWESDAEILRYIDKLPSGPPAKYEISASGTCVQVTVIGDIKTQERLDIVERVSWMLAAEQDLSGFYHAAAGEPKLNRAVTNVQGRILRSATVFEDVLKTMLTTNTAWSGTIRMVSTLLDLYGGSLQEDAAERAFPTPARIASSSEKELREQARLGYRAPYVLELAQAVDSGELELEAYKETTLPTEELRKQLLAIKGIGAYAAANLLMLLGRYDYIPIDSWALKTVSAEWFNGEPVNKDQVEQVFQRWGDWKGLVYWFWDYSSDA